MTESKAHYDVPQVTNYDEAAELLARLRVQLPPAITTAEAYMEAVRLSDAVLTLVEGFEKSQAFKRITGAQ